MPRPLDIEFNDAFAQRVSSYGETGKSMRH
jgi:hypothetical protein